ncbi:hypothetical protein HQ529_00495 [Candidatus Woesearchaeota archaeon]|nr:hypothetical protein [Candidatus Woesearchaeota archaeon]
MEKKDTQKRQVAYKAWINDIVNGEYIKQEGWEPNYIETRDGRRISRANIIGVVISKDEDASYKGVVLDDGSQSISIRSFEEKDIFSDVDVGSTLMIIGRPRKYGETIYIMPEIVKKIENIKWIELRKLELGKPKELEESVIQKEEKQEVFPEKKEEERKPTTESEKIYGLIKEMDNGVGTNIEELIKKSGISNCENIVNNMLKEGDIFEVKPGVIKVLE